jgi:UDP-glucose 4-epimerase
VTILVTGGAGFIGSTLAHSLSARGDSVRVIDDLSTGLAPNLDGTSAELVVGSFTDPEVLDSCLADVTSIVHLGARGSVPRSVADPVGTHLANATGTLTVLEAARRIGAHVVFSSSSSVYGANSALPKREEMWGQPLSPYGASKLAAESYCLAYRQVYGMDVLALRFFNVYGPRQRADHDYAAVIPKFAWAALQGEPLVVHGDGEQTRDFTHVDSVVRILVDALDRRVSWDRPVNLAFGDRVTVNGIAAEIGRQLERELEVVHAPARPGDVRDSRNDPALLLSLFPGEAVPVPFGEGIETVLAWMSAATPSRP